VVGAMDENGNPMDFSNWGGEYQPFQGDKFIILLQGVVLL
jgi:hypothetical protein